MTTSVFSPEETGLEVLDLRTNPQFAERRLHERNHEQNVARQLQSLQRLARAFVDAPDTILQELVDTAMELCGADSAGISLELEDRTDERFYHWVATAGQYKDFLNATLPRYPSACGVCLERRQPQHFRVGQRFFDILGVEAPLVTDGILLPWHAGETQGTIFIMAHGRTEAFDSSDSRMMEALADFAAMAVRHQQQQRDLRLQASAAAAAAMANNLAHQINNPLQSLTNLAYLATTGTVNLHEESFTKDLFENIERLSDLVRMLLAIPIVANRN